MSIALIVAIIGIIVAILGVAAPFAAPLLLQERKGLRMSILSDVSSDELAEAIAGEVRFILGDQVVEGLRVTDILIENRGARIVQRDYGTPITLSLEGPVHNVKVIRTNPEAIAVPRSWEDQQALLGPVRLETGESIVVRVTSSSARNSSIRAALDIVGVRERETMLRQKLPENGYGGWLWLRFASLVGVTAGAAAAAILTRLVGD